MRLINLEDGNGNENDPQTPEMSRAMDNPFPNRSMVENQSIDTYNGEFVRTNRSNQMKLTTNNSNNNYDKSFISTIPRIEILQLQVLAVNLLAEIGSKFEIEFLELNGPVRLYNACVHYCKSDDENHINMISTILILFNRLLLISNNVKSVLEELNIVQFCLFLFQHTIEECTKAQAVRAISILCGRQNSVCQTQLRANQGIQVLVLALKHCVGLKPPVVGLRAGMKVAEKYSLEQVRLKLPIRIFISLNPY